MTGRPRGVRAQARGAGRGCWSGPGSASVHRRRAARRRATMIENHWLATNELAAALGLGAEVRESLYQTFERWDGKGVPAEATGEEILRAGAPGDAGGRRRGLPPLRRRGGGGRGRPRAQRHAVRPGARRPVLRRGAERCSTRSTRLTTWAAVIEAEPALEIVLSDAELESALEAIADFTDLKSPWTIGHSRGVADLAGAAAHALRALGRRRHARAPGGAGARPRPAGRLQRDLGQAGPLTAGRARAGAAAPVPDRADARVLRRAGAARRDRRPAPRAARRLGLSARAGGRRARRRRGGSSRRPTPTTR